MNRINGIAELKAGKETNPKKLAGSITIEVKEHGKVEISYIGAGAGNVVTKAIAIARGNCLSQGADIWSYPTFTNTKVLNEDGTEESKVGMRVVVENKTPTLTK